MFLLCSCLLSLGGYAQPEGIESALISIEQNNIELQALAAHKESIRLELKSRNNLPDPQIGGYYLPFGEHMPGDYSEFEISQSFEFPSVYSARKKWIDQSIGAQEMEFDIKRQEILLMAKQRCVEIIHLRKQMNLERNRTIQSKKVFEQIERLNEEGQIGILELNKAKVAWIQIQFSLQELENEERGLLLSLNEINGGQDLVFEQIDFKADLQLAEKDSLWKDIQDRDPVLRKLEQEKVVAAQRVKLAKSQGLPGLALGYNYQGVVGSNYSGIYAGLSIPLWSNKKKQKAASSYLDYQNSYSRSETAMARTDFEKRYNEYQLFLSQYEIYRTTLNSLNSETLLLQAFELGEISFMEYYMELQFYRTAVDAMLQHEKQMHQLQATLQRHLL
jgi:cobalt-zinc-cadmium efflux system outer membrane protein